MCANGGFSTFDSSRLLNRCDGTIEDKSCGCCGRVSEPRWVQDVGYQFCIDSEQSAGGQHERVHRQAMQVYIPYLSYRLLHVHIDFCTKIIDWHTV